MPAPRDTHIDMLSEAYRIAKKSCVGTPYTPAVPPQFESSPERRSVYHSEPYEGNGMPRLQISRPAGLWLSGMGVKILCAAKGAGKTTFLRQQVANLAALGRSVGGIAAPAVFEHNRRKGYDLIDLRRGSRRPLARLRSSHEARPFIGGYEFDEAAIAAGNATIIAAVHDGLDVIAIDEVGPLEFEGKGWAPALEVALRDCRSTQELIVVVRPALMDELARRFPSREWAAASHVSPPWPTSLWT